MLPARSGRLLLLAMAIAATCGRPSLATCLDPNFRLPAITYPPPNAVLNELTVTVTWETVGSSWFYRLDLDPNWHLAGNGYQTLFNLPLGVHTFNLLTGCLNTMGGSDDAGIVSVSFTIDPLSTTTLVGGSGTTSTTSTTLVPPPPPAVGSTTVDASLASNKRLAVRVNGTLTLPAGADASLACLGGIDGLATFKKSPPIPGSGSLALAAGVCTFGVDFDLPRKVLRHKVLFALSFFGNERMGPLDISRMLKVKKTKKP